MDQVKIFIRRSTLVVSFPARSKFLSWAPFRGGRTTARHWINHQVNPSFKLQCDLESPARTLRKVANELELKGPVVGQMTSGDIRKFKKTSLVRKGWEVLVVGTAGFSNAVRVGDRAGHGSDRVGTINLLVWVSRPLALSSLLEVLQVAVEARTLAVLGLKVRSKVSRKPATGTGTDCVAVVCPEGKGQRVYAGKHTVLGELVGKAVLRNLSLKNPKH